MKTCSKCKIGKSKAEFSKDASKKDGLVCQCKACVREYRKANTEKFAWRSREYYKANAEKTAERQREYRKANSETIAERNREYCKANAEKVAEYHREYRETNAEKIAEYHRKYAKANPEKIAAKGREYRKANPEKNTAYQRNRRARVRNADGSHTASDIRSIFTAQRGLCANCKAKLFKSGVKKYHVDHIHPLALGGSNDRLNLQCLCPACNLSKNAKDPIRWAQQNGRLL